MARSILQNKNKNKDTVCYLCREFEAEADRRPAVHEHHIMYGTANRRLSEKYGLKVYLCLYHHEIGPKAVHNNREMDLFLRIRAQKAFEQIHTREEWMRIFGRNYL